MAEARPFKGLIVVDFTHVLAGPACAYYLGLLGADVIKVESVEKGDAIRHRGGTSECASSMGMSTAYLAQASGKRSLALDLESEAGRKTIGRLLSRADIFVENHRPRTMKRLGLDEETTGRLYPRLIHCAMTGYGRGGPQENAPAYDVNIQAASGLMALTGTEESGPTRTGAPIFDYATALAASFAISAALFEREKTGKGSFIDVSMLETGLSLMSSTITDYLMTGNEPRKRGNLANSRSPGAGSFACKSGMISLGVNEEAHFENLAKALEREDWLTDPRFAKRAERNRNAATLVEQLQAELLSHDAEHWEALMQTCGVPAARIRTLPSCLSSEQVRERAFIHEDPATGVKVSTLPFRLNGESAHSPERSAPMLGEHTDRILEWLVDCPQHSVATAIAEPDDRRPNQVKLTQDSSVEDTPPASEEP